MIQSFRCKDTRALFEGHCPPQWKNLRKAAERKLGMLNTAIWLSDLLSPPNNHLKALKRDRLGQHAIRINDQFRVCFVWTPAGPTDVEIVDYH